MKYRDQQEHLQAILLISGRAPPRLGFGRRIGACGVRIPNQAATGVWKRPRQCRVL